MIEFLLLEAEKDGFLLQFSEDESEKITDELDNFINGDLIEKEDVSFYRERNPLNPLEAICLPACLKNLMGTR